MPLIPNYISRFRTQSQSTATTSVTSRSASHSTATTLDLPTPVPELVPLKPDDPLSSNGRGAATLEGELARKIHPDLNSLISETMAQARIAEEASTTGLRPPRRKSRSAGHLMAKKLEPVVDDDQPGDTAHDPHADTSANPSGSPRSPPFFSRILSMPMLGGPRPSSPVVGDDDPNAAAGSDPRWSTFGRRRPLTPQSAGEFEFGTLQPESGSNSPSTSKRSSLQRRFPRSSAALTFSTGRPSSRAATARTRSDSQADSSPPGTLSSFGSKTYSQNSQSTRSRGHTLASYPETIPDNEGPRTPARSPLSVTSLSPESVIHEAASPQPTRPYMDGSPNTFGRRPTPERPTIPFSESQAEIFFTPSRTSTPPPPGRLYRREPPNTYPPRSRRRTSEENNVGSVSFPSIHMGTASSRTRAEDLFSSGSGHEVSRRVSADWSATEALIKDSNGDGESWPAIVSREMVRLSLGSSQNDGRHSNTSSSPGRVESISEAEELNSLQEEPGHKNPTIFGSVGRDRRMFLRASRRNTTPSISEALAAAASQQSGGVNEPLRPLPESLAAVNSQFKIGSRTVPRVSITQASPTSAFRNEMDSLSSDQPSQANNELSVGTSMTAGKRKMNDSEDELPIAQQIGRKSILVTRTESSDRPSDASHGPSSFRQPKRIRLSTPSHHSPHDHDHSIRSLPSSHQHLSPPCSPTSRAPSRASSQASRTSIPIRAIISPKPPSIDRPSIYYHMRDPDLPPSRRQSSQWTGGARKIEEEGQSQRLFPLQGWAFIIGFFIFPLWWLAAIMPIRWGWSRGVGSQDVKGVWTEDELALRGMREYDVAYAWRKRCRIMSIFGLFVYVPIIVLLAVFLPRTL